MADRTENVARTAYCHYLEGTSRTGAESEAEFDMWLAQVKADALREAAGAMPEEIRMAVLEVYEVDYVAQLPEHARATLLGVTRFAERLLARAVRIEKAGA